MQQEFQNNLNIQQIRKEILSKHRIANGDLTGNMYTTSSQQGKPFQLKKKMHCQIQQTDQYIVGQNSIPYAVEQFVNNINMKCTEPIDELLMQQVEQLIQ